MFTQSVGRVEEVTLRETRESFHAEMAFELPWWLRTQGKAREYQGWGNSKESNGLKEQGVCPGTSGMAGEEGSQEEKMWSSEIKLKSGQVTEFIPTL